MPEEIKVNLSSAKESRPPLGRDNLLSIFELGLEPFVLVVSLWAVALYFDGELSAPYLILTVLLFAITFPGTPRLGMPMLQTVWAVAISWAWTASLLVLTGYATGYEREFSRQAMLTWLVIAPVSVLLGHILLRLAAPALVRLQGRPRRAIIVGMNSQGVALASRVGETPYTRIELYGFFDDRDLDRLDASSDYRMIGKLSELSKFVREKDIQLIYLSLPMASQPRILQVLDELKDTTASIFFVPDMFVTDLIQGRTGSVCGMPVISVCETPFTGGHGFIKRISDIVLSIIILLLISPILVTVFIAVKMGSPGPAIFRQRRYGLDGKEIVVYKFRSMTVTEDGGKVTQATKNDSRVTPLGAILRRTSIDELPQFVNVLQGRMSIVGPRPHAVSHNEMYRKLIKGYMVRHKVKPGITGWAQINGCRGETDTLDKMQSRIDYDLDYLRNWSLRLDLYIIFRTVKLVSKDQQAY
ncbi:undecaprenyl-phosphate glucose phosphotransferase [Rhodoferax lacus]|uniref:Undecaprenyl-phosphate glucose phosphotransferase n=1 Tax=Rhodoferax lacus TaxID=2184758 RepID=A0A3E1RF32_9BURK|nr:undecaprenyl-phosphate glucose phosphotransferase [Rhodoferax lacus]RFO97986.1 undecaprenyl-phosphate glucose phosphotransferase [Rhodoferax lacus]